MVSSKNTAVQDFLGAISEESVRPHLQALSTVRHADADPDGLRQAAEYIFDRMKNYGLDVSKDPLEGMGENYPNIVGQMRRREPSQEIVLVGAHYDTVDGSPGADDNASGVAVMLEVARLLAQTRGTRTLQFIGFTFEEAGFLGSDHYARRIRRSNLPLYGAIVLECVGFTDVRPGSQSLPPGLPIPLPDRADFIGVVGNQGAKGIADAFEKAGRRYVPMLPIISLVVPERGEPFPDTRRSDHVPFWDLGYPAVLLTDTANFRNPHYHSASDRLETLDLPFIVSVARTLAATLVEEAGLTLERQ